MLSICLKRCSFVMVLISLSALPIEAQTTIDNLQREANSNRHFAAKYFTKVNALQNEIITLPDEYLKVAVLAAAGLLNTKFIDWGKREIASGKTSKKEVLYSMGVALMHLSTLTQAAGLNDATSCHMRESRSLIDMAKGKSRSPLNCRAEAYGIELRTKAITIATTPEFKNQADDLINQWATYTIMLSHKMSKLDLQD